MTNRTRLAGGIIAIICGTIILLFSILNISSIGMIYLPESLTTGYYTFITGGAALTGGILLCVNIRAGGIIAICCGAYYIIIGYIMLIYIWLGGTMFSVTPIIHWPIHLGVLFGGILGLNITFEA